MRPINAKKKKVDWLAQQTTKPSSPRLLMPSDRTAQWSQARVRVQPEGSLAALHLLSSRFAPSPAPANHRRRGRSILFSPPSENWWICIDACISYSDVEAYLMPASLRQFLPGSSLIRDTNIISEIIWQASSRDKKKNKVSIKRFFACNKVWCAWLKENIALGQILTCSATKGY